MTTATRRGRSTKGLLTKTGARIESWPPVGPGEIFHPGRRSAGMQAGEVAGEWLPGVAVGVFPYRGAIPRHALSLPNPPVSPAPYKRVHRIGPCHTGTCRRLITARRAPQASSRTFRPPPWAGDLVLGDATRHRPSLLGLVLGLNVRMLGPRLEVHAGGDLTGLHRRGAAMGRGPVRRGRTALGALPEAPLTRPRSRCRHRAVVPFGRISADSSGRTRVARPSAARTGRRIHGGTTAPRWPCRSVATRRGRVPGRDPSAPVRSRVPSCSHTPRSAPTATRWRPRGPGPSLRRRRGGRPRSARQPCRTPPYPARRPHRPGLRCSTSGPPSGRHGARNRCPRHRRRRPQRRGRPIFVPFRIPFRTAAPHSTTRCRRRTPRSRPTLRTRGGHRAVRGHGPAAGAAAAGPPSWRGTAWRWRARQKLSTQAAGSWRWSMANPATANASSTGTAAPPHHA